MTSPSLLNILDWEPFSETGIELAAEQIDRAIEFAQPISDPDQQWKIYLHLLALAGFEQWLSERSPDLTLDATDCVLFHPQTAALLGSVCNLQVGEFKVGLIATGSLADTAVNVPRAMIDLSAYAAQFYVLMEVLEEQQQVRIQGYARADQLPSQPTTAQEDTYSLPVDQFCLDADNLLLNLRCLEPTAIPLPAVAQPTVTQPITAANPGEVVAANVLPNVQNSVRENSAFVLNNILNVATWFQGQLDQLAEQMAWVLLPPAIQPVGLRSTVAEWDVLLDNLMQSGLHIPETAARAYCDFEWEGNRFRLHAITWELPSIEPEWVLLLVLGGQPDDRLPIGSRLQVRDEYQTLVEQELSDADRMYLYAQVVGHQDEQFWVSIGSHMAMLSLPPFASRS